MVDAQAVSTSTPCRNVLVKDNIEWLLNSNDSSAKESAMDISIHDNTDQPNKKNDFQTKYKKITAVPSKLHELLPNKKVPVTHTTANKVYESLENISNQRLGLNTTKEKFHEHYNDLKIKKAKIELEIAEIE